MFSCFCFTTNPRCRLRRLSGSARPFGLNSNVFPHFKPRLLLLMGLSYCTLWYHSMSLVSNRCKSSHNQFCTFKLLTTFWFIDLVLFIIRLMATSLQIQQHRAGIDLKQQAPWGGRGQTTQQATSQSHSTQTLQAPTPNDHRQNKGSCHVTCRLRATLTSP